MMTAAVVTQGHGGQHHYGVPLAQRGQCSASGAAGVFDIERCHPAETLLLFARRTRSAVESPRGSRPGARMPGRGGGLFRRSDTRADERDSSTSAGATR